MTPFLSYILQASIALAVLYGIYEILLKRETFFQINRIYLVSSLLLAFLIPAIPVVSPFRTAAGGPAFVLAEELSPAGAASLGFGLVDLLPYLYWAGVMVFLFRFGFQLARLARVIRRNGIRRIGGVKVVTVDREFPPFSFLGIIFLGQGLDRNGNLRRILAHEGVHIHQLHTFDVLLMEIVLSLQWFNPFVWPYKKALQATHEYLADAGVIAQGFSSVRYQLLMFEQHIGASLFELGNNFKRSQITRRIMMLSKAKSPNAAKLKLLLALPLVCALVLMFAEPRAAASPIAGAAAGQEKVVKAVDPSSPKAHQAQEDLTKLAVMEKDLRAKLAETQDQAERNTLKKKLETVLKKRQEIETYLAQAGAPPPPPGPSDPPKTPPPPPAPSLETLKAQYKSLVEKEANVKAQLEKTTDETKKAELSQTLEKIRQKQAQVKEMAAAANGGDAKVVKVPKDVAEIEDGLVNLKAKQADIEKKLEVTTDAKQIEELKTMLEKVIQMQEVYKAALAKAKGNSTDKAEKLVKGEEIIR